MVKQAGRGRVFEAPEAETQQKVSVLEEEEEASGGRSCWSAPPPVVAVAERGARL